MTLPHFTRHSGKDAMPYFEQLARLRIDVFRDFPYLYDGDLSYERSYLETYFSCPESFLCLCWVENQIVGACTGIPLAAEEKSFQKPFLETGINPNEVFYFGESILYKNYRGFGIGKQFFVERENYARGLREFKYLSFCAVERDENHSAKPTAYKPLWGFWENMGFTKQPKLRTQYSWKDVGESKESLKNMQFWMKGIL